MEDTMNLLDKAGFDAQQARYQLQMVIGRVPFTLIGRERGGLDWLREMRTREQAAHPERGYQIVFVEWNPTARGFRTTGPVPDDYQEPTD